MSSHSTVKYVEPNAAIGYKDWKYTDDFDRAPRLEDYCIALNIEVEVSSRDSQVSKETPTKNVIILQWDSSGGKKDSVSFLGGTKIGGYDINGTTRTPRIPSSQSNLTTYYADMYVGDLIDYGTTEMIGIKSVDIEYLKSCVPIITVQFTDVRGLSLFQPTELSRSNSYEGIKGLNKDNIAQSFFQCFFKMPLPKFTIYIKGFYGDPVAYTVMCDKFDTNFNSNTGDYDATARFIGYSYSFLTDVSFDALMAAPYSDYEGKRYWDENVANKRFFLWDKLHTRKMEMPTLFEINNGYKELLLTSNKEMEETTIEGEANTHLQEKTKLENIRKEYDLWYSSLFNVLKTKYGKRYVYDFKEKVKENPDWHKIIILANSNSIKTDNLSNEYSEFPDDFKRINDKTYALIEDFNNSSSGFKKLDNISKDFSQYTKINLFNKCYVNKNTKKIEFGGFSREFTKNRTEIVNRLFNDNSQTSKEYTLSSIYGDGVDQYTYAFIIEVDYSEIKRRINALILEENKSQSQKDIENKRKEHNRIMMSKMNWYPSVENFTRVMIAHLETFMMMMYKVSESCGSRTAEKLGIGDENLVDTNKTTSVVPPFPRVVKNEIGDDNITKTVDSWVGEWDNGDGFIEVDMINGLFNAIDCLDDKNNDMNERIASLNSSNSDTLVKMVKHPLTSYDFFLTRNPFGNYSDARNNPNAFAGKIAIRMFDVLALSNFKKEFSNNFKNGDFVKKIGALDAENFHENNEITNRKMLQMLGVNGDNGSITPSAIIDCVKKGKGIGGNNDIPWMLSSDDNLFDNSMNFSKYTTSYSKDKQKTTIYQFQNLSFEEMDETLKYFNKGVNSVQYSNNDIAVNWIDCNSHAFNLIKSDNKSSFGSVYIVDDYNAVSKMIEGGNTEGNDSYKEVYDLLRDRVTFNAQNFGTMIYEKGVFVPKKGISTKDETLYEYQISHDDDYSLYIKGKTNIYAYDKEEIVNYVNNVNDGGINSWFLSECRGVVKNGSSYALSRGKSLVKQNDFQSIVNDVSWGFNNEVETKKIGFILMSFDAIDYTSVGQLLKSSNTFTYLPRLAVLQIGAALASLPNLNYGEFYNMNTLSARIPLPEKFEGVLHYINSISPLTKIAYIKYFTDWVNKNNSEIIKNLLKDNSNIIRLYKRKSNGNVRALFKEDSDFTAFITTELMSCVCVAKGNVYHFDKNSSLGTSSLGIDENIAIKYLEGFLEKLRELCGKVDNSGGSAIKFAKEPTKVNDDMKKELYRYLKLLYDKWIPSTPKENWKIENFFPNENGEEEVADYAGGHMFHFIDSFYNKIGEKLLINPSKLCERIDLAMQNTDVNVMMLGFMADVYSQNKCMMLCLQNFIDLGYNTNNGMDRMFKPIPYNEMRKPNKHPDFVILYPYEPSKNLNIDNNEFNDDSFMLNDEFDTPLPIRSRGEDKTKYYNIPAFGVTYGKQYQSYFKNISVGTSHPIATQQSILAKHSLLRRDNNGKSKTAVAQDLYDIYTNQSYTCKVEMMGCAWVQPLMYFVLTNVPMFRGSYLIFKVKHSIKPGDMITTFEGTRMSNVSNKLIEDIFTDEDPSISLLHEQDIKYQMADTDNDCPYKIYPLYESNIEISKDEYENAKNAMDILVNEYEFTRVAAAGICGNIYQESKWVLNAEDENGSFGLCQWLDYKNPNTGKVDPRKTRLFERYQTNKPNFKQQLEYIKYEWHEGDQKAKNNLEKLNSAKDTNVSAKIVCDCFERPNEAKARLATRQKKAEEYLEYYEKNPTNFTNDSKPNQSDIYEAFFNAVNKTAKSTPSIGVELNNGNKATNTVLNNKSENKILIIQQANGKTDKLSKVFDAILNSSYFNYVKVLAWVTNGNDTKTNPLRLQLILEQDPNVENKRVLVVSSPSLMMTSNGISNLEKQHKFGNDSSSVNENLLKSLFKKYNGRDNQIPQFTDEMIFKDIKIKNCAVLINTDTQVYSPSDVISANAKIKIDKWDVGNSIKWIEQHAKECRKGVYCGNRQCAKFVTDAIGCDGSGLIKVGCGEGKGGLYATNLWYDHLLENRLGFKCIHIGNCTPTDREARIELQAGDVAVIGRNARVEGGKYHACIWSGSQWISDYKQGKNMSPYSDKICYPGGTLPYAIFRYHNKKGVSYT